MKIVNLTKLVFVILLAGGAVAGCEDYEASNLNVEDSSIPKEDDTPRKGYIVVDVKE